MKSIESVVMLTCRSPFLNDSKIRKAIDNGVAIDLMANLKGVDGDVTGAYATKGGDSAYEVRTRALSSENLQMFRDYLVGRYRPASHSAKWAPQDYFFEVAHLMTAAH